MPFVNHFSFFTANFRFADGGLTTQELLVEMKATRAYAPRAEGMTGGAILGNRCGAASGYMHRYFSIR